MIDDDDLTIDGADLMAEILADRHVPPIFEANTVDRSGSEHPTVTESPLAAPSLDGRDERTKPTAAEAPARWSPPVSATPPQPVVPSVGGMGRLQLAIVVAVFALGIAVGTAIGFARASGDTVDDQPASVVTTGVQVTE